MDFVVFGFGLGAILMLVGFALRDLGPWLFGSARQEDALPEFEGAKTTIRKQTLSSIGNAISVAGAGVAAVTFSALLAKAEDDLGAIVVGMSLVLATIGVGAWTYDVFRRYRIAMDIVAFQEQAAHERMAPRAKRRRPKPAPVVEPVTEQVPVDAPSVDPDELPHDPMVAAADPGEEPESEIEREYHEGPLPDWDAGPEEGHAASDDEPADQDAAPERPATPVDSSVIAARIPESPSKARDIDVEKPTPAGPVPQPIPDPLPEPPKDGAEALPPLPDLADDALIDEAVRLEPRPEPKRQIPSWLFEDLEKDLATGGPSKTEDPIDHFQEARPVTRPSALERLLSEDGTPGEQTDDSNAGQPRKPVDPTLPKDDD